MRAIPAPVVSEEVERRQWPFGTINLDQRRALAQAKAREVLETVPPEYRHYPRHLIVGSQQVSDANLEQIQEFVHQVKRSSPPKLIITGNNGMTNKAVAEVVNGPRCRVISPEMVAPEITSLAGYNQRLQGIVNTDESWRIFQILQETDMVCLALADEITIFIKPSGSAGALGMSTSASIVFGKRANKITLHD